MINWVPLCTLEYVEFIERQEVDGVVWEVGAHVQTWGFPRMEVLSKYLGGEVRNGVTRGKDEGIHAHEFRHVSQWWMCVVFCLVLAALLVAGGYPFESDLQRVMLMLAPVLVGLAPFVHALLVRRIRFYRLECELGAYAVQRREVDGWGGYLSIEDTAWALTAPRYDFGLTYEQALQRVREHASA